MALQTFKGPAGSIFRIDVGREPWTESEVAERVKRGDWVPVDDTPPAKPAPKKSAKKPTSKN